MPLGINLAVIEYTLAPAARLDRIVDEVRRAIQWLGDHLEDYGADPSRLHVSGSSAGSHLTAMVMPPRAVRGGLAISGIYDLEPIRLNYLNARLGLDRAEAERNSPIRHIPASAPALIIAYGLNELPELRRQSTDFAEAWRGRELSGLLLPTGEANHFTILEQLAPPRGELTAALLDMLGQH